jgi:hypothetical protein
MRFTETLKINCGKSKKSSKMLIDWNSVSYNSPLFNFHGSYSDLSAEKGSNVWNIPSDNGSEFFL